MKTSLALSEFVKPGARPCELFGARLEGRTLIITSAKVSTESDRGLGEDRKIELLDFDEFDIEGLKQLLSRLDAELAAVQGNRTPLVRRYGAAWRELRKEEAWAATITLRTTRSQFRATIKRAELSNGEMRLVRDLPRRVHHTTVRPTRAGGRFAGKGRLLCRRRR